MQTTSADGIRCQDYLHVGNTKLRPARSPIDSQGIIFPFRAWLDNCCAYESTAIPRNTYMQMQRFLAATLLSLSATATFAASTTLNGTVRDFNADGVNFEGPIIGLIPGLVENTLSGLSPTLTALGTTNINAANFSQWFTKATDNVPVSLTLNETAPGSGIFEYSSNARALPGMLEPMNQDLASLRSV